jgi:hypothetical protein
LYECSNKPLLRLNEGLYYTHILNLSQLEGLYCDEAQWAVSSELTKKDASGGADKERGGGGDKVAVLGRGKSFFFCKVAVLGRGKSFFFFGKVAVLGRGKSSCAATNSRVC